MLHSMFVTTWIDLHPRLVAGFVLWSSRGTWETWGRGAHKGEQCRKKGGAHANTVFGAPPLFRHVRKRE